MARYWLHTGFLTVEGKKMSKSLGNFITIRDFLKTNSPSLLRLLILKSHYRSPLDYSQKLAIQTKKEIERISNFVEKLKEVRNKDKANEDITKIIKRKKEKFLKAMDDDFNTPKAIAVIFEFINKINSLIDQNKINKENARNVLAFFDWINKILEIKPESSFSAVSPRKKEKIKELIKEREKYRKRKEWKKADKIREKIKNLGYLIEDTDKGPRIKRII